MKKQAVAPPKRGQAISVSPDGVASHGAALAAAAGSDGWLRSILTDREGNFDAGAVLTCIVTLFACFAAGWTTVVHRLPFNAQDFGIGIGAVLAGFAAYKVSDTKRPPAAAGDADVR